MLAHAKRPALVIVDMQNDFVRVGAPMEVPAARTILPDLARVLAAFRTADLPVIYTRYVAAQEYRHLRERLSWLKLIEPPVSACVPGHKRQFKDIEDERDGADVIDELAPMERDLVVDKIYFSAFHGTALQDMLCAAKVDSLVVSGAITEMCVEDTARHAVHHAYPTAILSDCVASNSPDAQAATLRAFAENYGWVMDSIAACAAIQACATEHGKG